jgi:hypothetical protein
MPIPLTPKCPFPWCGVEGKLCVDCAQGLTPDHAPVTAGDERAAGGAADKPCPYVVQSTGGTAHCALAEADAHRSNLERAVIDAAKEWNDSYREAERLWLSDGEDPPNWGERMSRGHTIMDAAIKKLRAAVDSLPKGEG